MPDTTARRRRILSPCAYICVAPFHQSYATICTVTRHSLNVHLRLAGRRRGAVQCASEQPIGSPSTTSEPVTKETPDRLAGRYRGTWGEFGRFARILLTAFLVLLLLLFFDILAALAAFTLGSFYAIAVLFGVRDVERWVPRLRHSCTLVVMKAAKNIGNIYRTMRREVRRRLADD